MANIINGTDTGSGGLITTGDSSDELQLQTAETTAITINSSQNVGIGTSFPGDYRLDVVNSGDSRGGMYVQSAGLNCWGLEIGVHTATSESDLVFTSNAVVGSQDSLSFVAESTGYVRFMTGGTSHKTGTDGATEVARFTPNGLTFNGDTAAANALDDYEEGTFTPTIYGITTAGSPTYTAQNGKYTKIGNVVIFNLLITLSNKGGMVGSLRIGDLPFTDISDSINAAVSIGNMSGMSITAGQTVMGRVVNNTSYISLFLTDSVAGNTNLQDTEVGNTFSLDVAGSYFVS